jgi:hypothetical protein
MGRSERRRAAGLTRRSAILAGSATALAAASPARAEDRWRTAFGLDEADFSAMSQTLGSEGRRLIHLDAYAVAGAPRFAAIWDQRPGPATIARRGLTSDEYLTTQGEMTAKGYRLSRVSGYESSGQPLYAALWTEGSGPDLQARHGLALEDYRRAFGALTEQGYRLTWVRGYGVAGAPQFAAIFEKDDGPDFFSKHNLDSAQYQAALGDATSQGYRLRHVCGYVAGEAVNFAAIWEFGQGAAWQAKHNLPADQLQAAQTTLGPQGYRLADVSGYGVGAAALYAAIWVYD